MSQCKLTLLYSRNYYKRRKSDDTKKTCICIVAEKITKLEICLIKASTLKLYKIINVSTNIQSKVEDAEAENNDIKP